MVWVYCFSMQFTLGRPLMTSGGIKTELNPTGEIPSLGPSIPL